MLTALTSKDRKLAPFPHALPFQIRILVHRCPLLLEENFISKRLAVERVRRKMTSAEWCGKTSAQTTTNQHLPPSDRSQLRPVIPADPCLYTSNGSWRLLH